jgi:hypothetical protein
MPFHLSRRRFLLCSALGVVGAGSYGIVTAVNRVRDAAGRMNSQ